MKKRFLFVIIFVLTVILLGISLYGCTTKQPVEEPAPSEEPNPVEQPTDDGPIEEDLDKEETIIVPKEKVDVTGLTLLDEYDFDFDKDGYDENIAMYTAAGRDSNGVIAWDDGQNWLFAVHDTDKDYVLIDEYVQLGTIDFFVFTVDDDFYIATVSARTASLDLITYKYDRENDSFIKTVPFNARGNVNMLKVSTR